MICFCIRCPPVNALRSMQVLCFCPRSARSRRHDGVRGSVRFNALRRARLSATTDHANSSRPRPASSARYSTVSQPKQLSSEVLFVGPHAMQGDRHSASQCDLGSTGALAICNPHGPRFHARPTCRRSENDIGRLEQGSSFLAVAHLRDATNPVDLPGLVPSWRQPR